MKRFAGVLTVCVLATAGAGELSVERISAESLRTNITWLAADERGGRMTPSPGLDASADYIAEQFRGAGLETSFQAAAFSQVTPNAEGFRLNLAGGGRTVIVRADNVEVGSRVALDYRDGSVVRLPAAEVAGRIVAGGEAYANPAELQALQARRPALILLAMEGDRPASSPPLLMEADSTIAPVLRIYSRGVTRLVAGTGEIRINVQVAAPQVRDVALRNVAGILRGSDPAARSQFVIVSAHYDHLGAKAPGPGNRIYHGANDDASGVASLIEIAKALHPRRSVMFLAVFGEEEGLLGSGYYVRHPLVPVARTVADINLEQLGRTDSSDGPELARFALSGPSFSNLQQTMGAAAKSQGTVVYKKENGDDYFDRSDNYSFALAGIVAHTVVVAFEFPDYHETGDVAGKLDYANLVKVDRGIAAGVEAVADAADVPKWSDAPGARVYRDAAVR